MAISYTCKPANMQFRLSNSQRYLVVGLVVLGYRLLLPLGLALWLVSGLALTKYRCEFDNLNCKLHTMVIQSDRRSGHK